MSYSKADLEKTVYELGLEQPWSHAIELPDGVWTSDPVQHSHGKNLVKWKRVQRLMRDFDVEGLRVLDVGCSDGYFSLQMSRAGAREVTALDSCRQRIRKVKFVMNALNIVNVSPQAMSIFDPRVKEFGRFDLSLCLGVLHRVSDPYRVIETLAARSDNLIFEWKSPNLYYDHIPALVWNGGDSVREGPLRKAYFRPTFAVLKEILASCGCVVQYHLEDPAQGRPLLLASRNEDCLPTPVPRAAFIIRLARLTRGYLAAVRDLIRG